MRDGDTEGTQKGRGQRAHGRDAESGGKRARPRRSGVTKGPIHGREYVDDAERATNIRGDHPIEPAEGAREDVNTTPEDEGRGEEGRGAAEGT